MRAPQMTYRDVNGKFTDRVIIEITMSAPFIDASCHLREDVRMFSLAGIESVSRA
jgi:hypothetical protein